MRRSVAAVILILLISTVFAQANITSEGGNITTQNITLNVSTIFWAGIVGWLNGTFFDPAFPASTQPVNESDIYTNEPNGSYITYYNTSMIVTRLSTKPNFTDMSTPSAADFADGGMFENFTTFAGLNLSTLFDGPLNTFCNPCVFTTCYIGNNPILCPFVVLEANTAMAVLKFSNGTHEEPLFVGLINNSLGYNGTFFDFEYMVPTFEDYYFYIYERKETCNITVWIDDVQTTTFPKTGVPYKVEFLATDDSSNPITNAPLRVVEKNGRNILYPILDAAKSFLGMGEMTTNASGRALFALSPTRYNIPDSYGYEAYVEVDSPSYYCRQNLSIANYGSLSPTYRTSLVNDAYGSQVKSSVQNMNSLASTASKWINLQKMRLANIDAYTNGTVTSPLPQLKAGAPNMINITAYDNDTMAVINATIRSQESDGFIIFVPSQPDKDLYNNTATFYTNETPVIIPTRYNNNANLTMILSINGTDFATLVFTVDSILEPPTGGEANMDAGTYALISSALQNINSVLSNIGKSISTV
jgi:hypothetical protein